MQAPGSSPTYSMVLLQGRGAPPSLELHAGRRLEPLSVGLEGAWQVEAPGVLACHGYVFFDGAQVFVQSADARAPVLVDGKPVPCVWTRVAAPCTVVLGHATIALRSNLDTFDDQTDVSAPTTVVHHEEVTHVHVRDEEPSAPTLLHERDAIGSPPRTKIGMPPRAGLDRTTQDPPEHLPVMPGVRAEASPGAPATAGAFAPAPPPFAPAPPAFASSPAGAFAPAAPGFDLPPLPPAARAPSWPPPAAVVARAAALRAGGQRPLHAASEEATLYAPLGAPHGAPLGAPLQGAHGAPPGAPLHGAPLGAAQGAPLGGGDPRPGTRTEPPARQQNALARVWRDAPPVRKVVFVLAPLVLALAAAAALVGRR